MPPIRPGAYDPSDYADAVMRSAEEAGVSPLLVMTVLHNEAYKPHHPLLERLWQWWKPGASFGVANMHRATFDGYGGRMTCRGGGTTCATIPASPSTRRRCT